jgi:hypothetical protein
VKDAYVLALKLQRGKGNLTKSGYLENESRSRLVFLSVCLRNADTIPRAKEFETFVKRRERCAFEYFNIPTFTGFNLFNLFPGNQRSLSSPVFHNCLRCISLPSSVMTKRKPAEESGGSVRRKRLAFGVPKYAAIKAM